jgi:hypothetical protein
MAFANGKQVQPMTLLLALLEDATSRAYEVVASFEGGASLEALLRNKAAGHEE